MESRFAIFLPSLFLLFGCFQADITAEFVVPQPKEIIDLGALVTEDLTIRVWGERYPREGGYDRPNVFDDQGVRPGDIVLIHTNYQPPKADDEYSSVISLTPEAAEFLARIPVRAFATEAWSVDVGPGSRASGSPTGSR